MTRYGNEAIFKSSSEASITLFSHEFYTESVSKVNKNITSVERIHGKKPSRFAHLNEYFLDNLLSSLSIFYKSDTGVGRGHNGHVGHVLSAQDAIFSLKLRAIVGQKVLRR